MPAKNEGGGNPCSKGSSQEPVDLEEEGSIKTLANHWEACRLIRSRLRADEHAGKLIRWPKPELVGHQSMAAIAMNVHALTILAKWWCPSQSTPKSPSVNEIRKEVDKLRVLCGASRNVATLQADAWGLKKLFTYGVRKSGADKDIGVNPFYDELFRHWNVRLKPGQVVEVVEIDSDDESSNFAHFIEVKQDPYQLADVLKDVAADSLLGKLNDDLENHQSSNGSVLEGKGSTKMDIPENKGPTKVEMVDDKEPTTKETMAQACAVQGLVSSSKPKAEGTCLPSESNPSSVVDRNAAIQRQHRIMQLQLELAKRQALAFAEDNAETQPLSASTACALASGYVPRVIDLDQVQDDSNDAQLCRSLQRDFSQEALLSEGKTVDGQVLDDSQVDQDPYYLSIEYPEMSHDQPLLENAQSEGEKAAGDPAGLVLESCRVLATHELQQCGLASQQVAASCVPGPKVEELEGLGGNLDVLQKADAAEPIAKQEPVHEQAATAEHSDVPMEPKLEEVQVEAADAPAQALTEAADAPAEVLTGAADAPVEAQTMAADAPMEVQTKAADVSMEVETELALKSPEDEPLDESPVESEVAVVTAPVDPKTEKNDEALGAKGGEKPSCDEEAMEPPVTMRQDQFALKPKGKAKAKAKAKASPKAKAKSSAGRGRGKGRGRGRKTGDAEKHAVVHILDDDDDEQENMEGDDEKPKAKPKAKGRNAKRKTQEAGLAEDKQDEMEDQTENGNQEPVEETIVWAPVSEKGKQEFSQVWGPSKPSGEDAASAKCMEAGKISDNGSKKQRNSFARRACPSTTPAKERWLAIAGHVDETLKPLLEHMGFHVTPWEVHWWDWCKPALDNTVPSKKKQKASDDGLDVLDAVKAAVALEIPKFQAEFMLVDPCEA